MTPSYQNLKEEHSNVTSIYAAINLSNSIVISTSQSIYMPKKEIMIETAYAVKHLKTP
jgi:hypothetical protein